MFYDMEQFMVPCPETFLTDASKTCDSFKYAATPFLDEDRLVESDDTVSTGALQPIASSDENYTRSRNGKVRSAQSSGQSCKERYVPNGMRIVTDCTD